MIAAVIYARYSSHGQTEQSIEGQLRDCYAYAQREGYTVIEEYIDRALTGRSDDRPDFQRMIADAAKKQFKYVIVWKLDRFARNRFDSANYKHILKKYGVRVVSATERISDDPEGIMLEGMLESLAEYYSANLSKHVKRGQRECVIKGTHTGGKTPFGFKVMNKRLVADEEKAPIIREMFERYASGVSKKEIIDALIEKGLRNGAGRPLTAASFQTTLRNRKYIGEYIYNGVPVTGGCDALVDRETFERVQKRLDATKRAPAAKKAKVEYQLSGKLFCGMCGARMIGESGRSKNKTIHYYYACGTRKKHHTCTKKNEKKEFIEWYVVEQTVLYVLAPERIEYIAERLEQQYEKEFGGGKVKSLERLLEKLEGDINKAVDASIEAPTPAARKRIFEKMEALEAQKTDAELDLARLKIVSDIHYSKEQIMAWMKKFCEGDPMEEDFRRRIIDVFINSVYLYDDKIVLYYNLKDGQQVSYMEMCEDMENLEEIEDSGGPFNVRVSDEPACHLKSLCTSPLAVVEIFHSTNFPFSRRKTLFATVWTKRASCVTSKTVPS